MQDRAVRVATYIAGLSPRAIVTIVALGFLLAYSPILILKLFLDQNHPGVAATLLLISGVLAIVVPLWLAIARIPWLHDNTRLRARERRGWTLIAVGSLLSVVLHATSGWRELMGDGAERTGLIGESLLAMSLLFLFAGLAVIPWSQRTLGSSWSNLNMVTVILGIGTLLLPIVLGPEIKAGASEGLALAAIPRFLGAVVVITAVILWMIFHDVRREMRLTALTFSGAVLLVVVVEALAVVLLEPVNRSGDESLLLLLLAGAGIATHLGISLAGLLRIAGLNQRRDTHATEIDLTRDTVPIPFWQMLMPYPLLMLLVITRMAETAFGLEINYRPVTVVGVSAILLLIMIRQIPMLRFNQHIHERLASSSIRDGLTGLYTHGALHEMLSSEIAQLSRRNGQLAVVFMDIDRFKSFNDTYGHPKGDQILITVGDVLRRYCRAGDMVGRYGGEEFMLLAPGIGRTDAFGLAERIREKLQAQRFIIDGKRVTITISLGIAMYPDASESADTLIELADQAMYEAKAAGGNQTVFYEGSQELRA